MLATAQLAQRQYRALVGVEGELCFAAGALHLVVLTVALDGEDVTKVGRVLLAAVGASALPTKQDTSSNQGTQKHCTGQ